MDTLLDLLDASAARFGDKPALLIRPGFRTRRWTYRDLAEVVPRVARVLAEAGLERGDRVVIWAVNRPEWGIAFFGALHAGAVLVPLDVRSLPDFAHKVAEKTRAKLVIASSQTLEGARTLGLKVHTIESLPDLARGREPMPRPDVAPNDLVEIVFTSGTTGDPKGAMLTHRNILSNAEAALQVFPLSPKRRLLSLLPLSHMFEQMAGFIAPLLAGASIAYPASRQPAVIFASFRHYRVSLVLLVPQALKLFDNAIQRRVDASGKRALFEKLHRLAPRLPMALRRVLFASVHRALGGRLHYIVSGGAALDPELGERWERMGMHVLQGYGTTECAPAVTFNRLGRSKMGTVGVALPGVDVRVAEDGEKEARGPGEGAGPARGSEASPSGFPSPSPGRSSGEVLVRGPNVFPGYWENEEATDACLEDGWYHTGDLGEMDADGFLTLRGRKKDMIVLADGTNVYPEDIENLLAHDPRVRDAAVIGLQRTGTEVVVHATLLLHDPGDADAVVRDANAKLTGSQQVRSHSVWPEDDFPRTHTLKVKKRLVLERVLADERRRAPAPVAAKATAAARSDVERLVAQVANVPIEALRPEARLSSDLDLDSLGRVELLGVIEEEIGIFIDDAALEPDTTVAQLEQLVEQARGERQESGIYGWPLHPLVRATGLFLQQLVVGPLVWLFYRVKVKGREHLRGLRGPVMFAPNHCLHWDNGIILTAIPLSWRWRLSIAAAADDIFGSRWRGLVSSVLACTFPLAREGAIRRSLELLGARLDRDFSVLIYPEGKLTVGGPLQPFKSGTGLVAVEGGTPVVPMKLKINRMSVVDLIPAPGADRSAARQNGYRMAFRGDVEVVFGRALIFPAETPFPEATKQIEAAVAAL